MHVIGSAWSADGSRLYMRVEEFRGMEHEPAERIYLGRQVGGAVQLYDVLTLAPPCDCGMCSFMERELDREFPKRKKPERDDHYNEDLPDEAFE